MILLYGLINLTASAQLEVDKGLSGRIIQTAVQNDTLEISLYPNPAKSGRVTIETNIHVMREIRVIDIGGREILLQKISPGSLKSTVQLNKIPDGIYFNII